MQKRSSAIIIALIAIILLTIPTPFLPWYESKNPEIPGESGTVRLFYTDRMEEYFIINGSNILHRLVYWTSNWYGEAWAKAIQTFSGIIILNVVVAVLSTVAIWAIATRGRSRVRRWMPALLVTSAWIATLYFVVSFTLLMLEWGGGWFEGFFYSEYYEQTGVTRTQGPGVSWYLTLLNAVLATIVAVLFYYPLLKKRKELREPEPPTVEGQNNEADAEGDETRPSHPQCADVSLHRFCE